MLTVSAQGLPPVQIPPGDSIQECIEWHHLNLLQRADQVSRMSSSGIFGVLESVKRLMGFGFLLMHKLSGLQRSYISRL